MPKVTRSWRLILYCIFKCLWPLFSKRGKFPGKIAEVGSNGETPLGQAIQMTRFSEAAFPMLQVRAREFAPGMSSVYAG